MHPPRPKRRRVRYDPEQSAKLERQIFGDGKDVIENLFKADTEKNKKNENVKIEEDANQSICSEEKSDSDAEESDNEIDADEADNNSDAEESENNSDAEESVNNSDAEESVNNSDNCKSEDDSDAEVSDNESNVQDSADESDESIENLDGAAWIDQDDKQYTVDEALRAQHRKLPGGRPEKTYSELLEKKFTQIVGTPKWSEIKNEDDYSSDSDHEILKHSNHLAPTKSKKLKKGTIEIKALKPINRETENEGPLVTSLQFHPTSTVAFVAGLSGILSIFQVDGKENTKLASMKFEKFAVAKAKFLKDGNEIILGSRYGKHSHVYDLMSGKTYKNTLPHNVTNMQNFEVSPNGKFIAIAGKRGEIYLLTGTTKELITTFKMNNTCKAFAFTPDSNVLFTHGASEEIYAWDLTSRTCIHRIIDDGCLSSSAIEISPNGQLLATGSDQSIVNIYDMKTVMGNRAPQPLKIVQNLVTPISYLKFNPTSEILAFASSFTENAFKMVHIPSFTVFSNFPTFQTVMNKPQAIDFSPGGAYLGITNDKNKAYLYRLKHFGNY